MTEKKIKCLKREDMLRDSTGRKQRGALSDLKRDPQQELQGIRFHEHQQG